jgi:hypothetical protein
MQVSVRLQHRFAKHCALACRPRAGHDLGSRDRSTAVFIAAWLTKYSAVIDAAACDQCIHDARTPLRL